MKKILHACLRAFAPVLTLAAAFTLGSCASVPYVPVPKSAYSALLIVPLEFQNQMQVSFDAVMSLNYDGVSDSKTGDVIRFDGPYGYITDLPPGNHRVTAVMFRWTKTNQILGQLETDIPFILVAGQATVLPSRVSVVLKDGRIYYSNYSLTRDQVTAMQTEIQGYKNMESWSFASP